MKLKLICILICTLFIITALPATGFINIIKSKSVDNNKEYAQISIFDTTNIDLNKVNNQNINYERYVEEIDFSEPIIKQNYNYIEIQVKEADSYKITSAKTVLPFYTKIFYFPLGTRILDVKCEISNLSSKNLPKRIIPNTEPIPIDMKIIKNKKNIEGEVYNLFDNYPSSWYTYKLGGGLNKGKHVTILSIQIFPVRYNSSINLIDFVKNVKIEINYKDLIKSKIINREEYDLLIISPSEFNNNLHPLIDHKNNNNIKTVLVNLEEINGIGRDKPEQIKYLIKDAIDNHDISFVLLVGNKSVIPVRYTHPFSYNTLYELLIGAVPSDLYYADIYNQYANFSSWDTNNNDIFGECTRAYVDIIDFYPDVAIGRLYCNNKSQVTDIVDKIIEYEKETYNQQWFKNIILCGGNTHPTWKDLLFQLPIFRKIYGDGRIAFEGEYICNKLANIFTDYNAKKFYASSNIFPSNNDYAEKLTVENINNAINEGSGFVFFIGHGNPIIWATHPPIFKHKWLPKPYYGINNIKDLENKGKYPVVILDACSCADFKHTDNPIAWEFVRLNKSGAIACFASTALSAGLPGTLCEKTLNNFFTLSIAEDYNDGVNIIGDLYVESINNYVNNLIYEIQVGGPLDFLTLENRILFGDPSLYIGGYQN
jgi:hypothetical protein